jgi:hypothetical protein
MKGVRMQIKKQGENLRWEVGKDETAKTEYYRNDRRR